MGQPLTRVAKTPRIQPAPEPPDFELSVEHEPHCLIINYHGIKIGFTPISRLVIKNQPKRTTYEFSHNYAGLIVITKSPTRLSVQFSTKRNLVIVLVRDGNLVRSGHGSVSELLQS